MVLATPDTIDQVSEQLCGEKFHSSTIPMWVFDQKKLSFLIVNQTAIDSYGFTREEFLSRTILDIRPREDIQRLLHETVSPHEHNSDIGVWRHMGKDGLVFSVGILSFELMFAGRKAELILAQKISAPET